MAGGGLGIGLGLWGWLVETRGGWYTAHRHTHIPVGDALSTMELLVEQGAAARLRSHSAPSAITPTPPPTTPSACRALLCMHHTAHTHTPVTWAKIQWNGVFSRSRRWEHVGGAQPPTAHTVRQTAHSSGECVCADGAPSAMNRARADAPNASASPPAPPSPASLWLLPSP